MEKINQTVLDAGPLIHLNEINQFKLLKLFREILTTKEILEECSKIRKEVKNIKNLVQKNLTSEGKDLAKLISEKYNLDLGESTGISLCKQEKIKFFFTDDLEARNTAGKLGLTVHGTVAIILRSLREKIINKEQSKLLINNLYSNSSMFFSKDLRNLVIKNIEKF